MTDPEQQRPWYRQFWPWFIAFPPAATVVGALFTAWLAGTGPSLVVDDYGQIGKVTTQRAVRDDRARELGMSARLGLDAPAVDPGNTVRVDLALTGVQEVFPDNVVMRIVHPTRAELDAETVLAGSRGHYSGRIARPPGRLYVHLSDLDRTWRLVGELAPRATELRIVAARQASRF
ncbi:MAG: FixH family protein [Gammaproteobacteria bacterium]